MINGAEMATVFSTPCTIKSSCNADIEIQRGLRGEEKQDYRLSNNVLAKWETHQKNTLVHAQFTSASIRSN